MRCVTWIAARESRRVLRIPAWQDNGSFYRSVLEAEPRSVTASYGLGAWLAGFVLLTVGHSLWTVIGAGAGGVVVGALVGVVVGLSLAR